MSQEQIETVLRAHQPVHGIRDMKTHCTCGWTSEPRAGGMLSHIAEALAATLAPKEGDHE